MKKLIILLLLIISFNSYSQYATKKYVDSLFNTLDTVVVKNSKVTTSNNTVTLDTLSCPVNKMVTYVLSLESQYDVGTKLVQISNDKGAYTLVNDKNISVLSRSFFSSTPKWNIYVQNNRIIVQVTGIKNKTINWILKKTTL